MLSKEKKWTSASQSLTGFGSPTTIFLFAIILSCQPPGLGSYLMRATTSYLYEGLVATALFEPAADHDRVSARCVRVS